MTPTDAKKLAQEAIELAYLDSRLHTQYDFKLAIKELANALLNSLEREKKYKALEQELADEIRQRFDKRILQEENEKLKKRLLVLQKYHAGDGTITREEVLKVLGEENG